TSLLRVTAETQGFKLPLYGVEWSPDSRHLVVTRIDERKLQDYYFLQLAPFNGDRHPKLVSVRMPLAGQMDLMTEQVSIIDTKPGAKKDVALGPTGSSVAGLGGISVQHYWDPTGSRFLAVQGNFSPRETLFEITVATAKARAVLTETNSTFLQISP